MSEQELKTLYAQFCRDMLKQIELHESGKPTERWFDYTLGLCHNAGRYNWTLEIYQYGLFYKVLNDSILPFNNGDPKEYRKEHCEDTIYENPKRLAWLREHSKE